MSSRSSALSESSEIQQQGFLFKLKENNKEWKRIYVVLRGGDIIYYDDAKKAAADKKQKDGVKQIVSASLHDEYSGFNAPTGTPFYMIIETTRAKKVYCAKSAEERQMWVDMIKKNAESFARAQPCRGRARARLLQRVAESSRL